MKRNHCSFPLQVLAILLAAWSVLLCAQQIEEKPGLTLKVNDDYLALHIIGRAPAKAADFEYRLTLNEASEAVDWLPFPQPVAADGRFQFDVPLPAGRWTLFEVRASLSGELLTAMTRPAQRPFVMLTVERLSTLPADQRAAWDDYLLASQRRAAHERDTIAAECRNLGLAVARPAPASAAEFEMDSSVSSAWYGTAEAGRLADAVLSFQTPSGGWSKAVDYAAGPRAPGTHWTNNADNPWHYCGTLDNRSTTEQIKFLAWVFSATGRADARTGAVRGLEWLLAAQYPNGGWPQNYPVEPGYHEAITLNDDAMLHAMEVLLSAATGETPFDFLDASLRQRAAAAMERAVAILLECQVRLNGQPAVWCAQHDPLTLEPVAARLKEPPSLSGAESANLLKFLMRKGPITPEVIRAVEGGLAWLEAHRITGLRKTKNAEGKTDYIEDAASSEVYWARFYEVRTGQPMFAGAEDGVVYSSFQEMARHNKVGYDYFSTKPADVVGKEVARWKKRLAQARP